MRLYLQLHSLAFSVHRYVRFAESVLLRPAVLCVLCRKRTAVRFVPYGITIWGIEFVVLGMRDLAKILFFD